ncbi:MAG: alanine--tRNA ligase-related protein, partial [Sulfolobaceae archaeon]
MATEELYLKDCYIREFKGKVIRVTDDGGIILDKTAFYPGGGGLDADTGVIVFNGNEFIVKKVYRSENGEIIHLIG